MNTKLIRTTVAAFAMVCLPFASFAETAEEKGLAIAVEADKRDEGFGDSTANMIMELKNKQGDTSTRYIRIKTLEVIGDGDKSMSIPRTVPCPPDPA